MMPSKMFCERSGLHPRVVQQADNVLGNLNMIRAGIGFALLPDYVTSILPKGVVVKPLAWTSVPVVSLVVAHRKGKPDRARCSRSRNFCGSVFPRSIEPVPLPPRAGFLPSPQPSSR